MFSAVSSGHHGMFWLTFICLCFAVTLSSVCLFFAIALPFLFDWEDFFGYHGLGGFLWSLIGPDMVAWTCIETHKIAAGSNMRHLTITMRTKTFYRNSKYCSLAYLGFANYQMRDPVTA